MVNLADEQATEKNIMQNLDRFVQRIRMVAQQMIQSNEVAPMTKATETIPPTDTIITTTTATEAIAKTDAILDEDNQQAGATAAAVESELEDSGE